VAAGLVLIGIAILAWLSMLKEKRTWRHYIGITSNFLIGMGVALLALLLVTGASDDFGDSPWILPLLVFVMFIGQSPSTPSKRATTLTRPIALLLNHVPRTSRFQEDTGVKRTV
jgi:hypothetical protein